METDTHNNINTDIELLSSQDTLREKLKEIEKNMESWNIISCIFYLQFFKKLTS